MNIFPTSILILCAAAASLLAAAGAQSGGNLDKGIARAEIVKQYDLWNAARTARDRVTFDKMLAPDAYVQLKTQRLSRQQFIDLISADSPGAKLVRFESNILTITPEKDEWVAVITEKLEYDVEGKDGKKHKAFLLWITRDGWHKEGDKWTVRYSEEVSHEQWQDTKPPFQGW